MYTFGGSGGDTDQLVMKTPRKTKKTVSDKYPFYFSRKKLVKGKFEGPYQENPQIAVSGTDHTVMTQDGRIIHKKRISKPLKIFQEGPSLRGQNPRDSIGRWTRMNSQTEERPELMSLTANVTNILSATHPSKHSNGRTARAKLLSEQTSYNRTIDRNADGRNQSKWNRQRLSEKTHKRQNLTNQFTNNDRVKPRSKYRDC